jgi:hypothetical protein
MSSLLVFKRVYRLEIQSVMLLFSTHLVKYGPSNLLTGSQKPRREGGLKQLKFAAKSLYTSIFKKSRHLGLESIICFVHAGE